MVSKDSSYFKKETIMLQTILYYFTVYSFVFNFVALQSYDFKLNEYCNIVEKIKRIRKKTLTP